MSARDQKNLEYACGRIFFRNDREYSTPQRAFSAVRPLADPAGTRDVECATSWGKYYHFRSRMSFVRPATCGRAMPGERLERLTAGPVSGGEDASEAEITSASEAVALRSTRQGVMRTLSNSATVVFVLMPARPDASELSVAVVFSNPLT